MNILSYRTLRELAKFVWDISKLTATAAFITPYFTNLNIEIRIITGMAIVATLTFFVGFVFHRISDDMENNEKEKGGTYKAQGGERRQEIRQQPKEHHKKNKPYKPRKQN